MSRLTVEQIVENNMTMARESMKESGEFIGPVFIIHSEEGFIPVVAPFKDGEEKKIVLRMVQLLNLKYRAYAYSVVHEAWFATRTAEQGRDFKGQVADLPDKKEAVVSSYVGYDRKEMHISEVERNGKEITLKEPTKFEGEVGGTFFELLPPAVLHDKPFDDNQKMMLNTLIQLVQLKMGIQIQMVPLTEEAR